MLTKAPTFDPAMRRLGGVLFDQGQREEGMAFLARALQLNRSPENLIAMANALADPGPADEASPDALQRALDLALEANRTWQDSDVYCLYQLANLYMELDRTAEFQHTANLMRRKFPNEMETHLVLMRANTHRLNFYGAELELKRAVQLGLPAEVAQAALDHGLHRMAMLTLAVFIIIGATLLWLVGLVSLFLLGKRMSNAMVRSIEASDPNVPITERERSLRNTYAVLINVAGIYYYISIPFVILFILALLGGVILLVMAIGVIPVKLMIILIVVSLFTIYVMIASLFARVKHGDPGRPLTEPEAPGLWALTREVALQVGTRPVGEIRLTEGIEVAVYERGSQRDKARDRATRVLLLGVGVLNDFTQPAFRAVLAHEYGHFSHRDTAGGVIARRVHLNMMALAERIMGVWWNLGFQFLRVYHLIFRRISFGATRLQEVLADRMAAIHYGPAAFEEGLRHVIRRSLAFDAVTKHEVHDAMEHQRALFNLYTLPAPDPASLEEMFTKALSEPTTEDDTHPAPADRFRLVHKLTGAPDLSSDLSPVWDLFTDRAAIEQEMLASLNHKLELYPGGGGETDGEYVSILKWRGVTCASSPAAR